MSSNSGNSSSRIQRFFTRQVNNNVAAPPSSSYRDTYKGKDNDYVRQKEHKTTLNVTREGTKNVLKNGIGAFIGTPQYTTTTAIEKNQNKRDAAREVRESRGLTQIPVTPTQRVGAGLSAIPRLVPGGGSAAKKYMEWTREAIEREDKDGIQRIGYTD